MRTEEEAASGDSSALGDDTSTDRLLAALKMRSEDLEHCPAASDEEAPIAKEVDLGLAGNMRQPGEAEPQGPQFYRDHGIDPSTLPTADGPGRDPGVTFDSLLHGRQPVGVLELSLVSRTTEVPRGKSHVSLHVQGLLLMGQLGEDGIPEDLGECHGVRLHIRDAAGGTLHLMVKGRDSDGMSARDFAAHVAHMYPRGTSVAFTGFDLIVLEASFLVVVNQEKDDAGAFCLGDDSLPPIHLFQISVQCTLLVKAGKFSAMAARAVDGLNGARPVLERTLVPLLTNLALAHLHLHQSDLALAYCVALQQLLFGATPAKAACIAASIMTELGRGEAAFAATVLGHFGEGDPLEWVQAVGLEALKVLGHVSELSMENHTSKVLNTGLRQMAEALADAQDAWMAHALGNSNAIKKANSGAQAKDGNRAVQKLKNQGDKLFQSGASSKISALAQLRIRKAILKWRAALWLCLDRDYDMACYSAWDILDTRHRHWDEVTDELEGPVLCFLDLTALAMMRADHVDATTMRHALIKNACSLGRWKDAVACALQEGVGGIGIMT